MSVLALDNGLGRRETGLLISVNMDEEYPFEDNNNMGFKKCRPVRRDEVTFYEGRESE